MHASLVLGSLVLLLATSPATAFTTVLSKSHGRYAAGSSRRRPALGRSHLAANRPQIEPLDADEINNRLRTNIHRMRERDRHTKVLGINDLKIGYEDDYIVVVDKPSGVLSMSSAEDTPSLCKTVYEAFGTDALSMEQMVVHRLGIDTGGLIVFARTPEAMRGLHTIFRSRQILKQYEALICGHLEEDEGIITMPLMRDYENPPYMRVSTRQHQEALATLDPTCVPKSFLEAPKPCITKYEVIDREEIGNNLPVTRVVLTSISGRTHQLNVHCAAFGHPIVADSVYGLDGEASPNGGLGKDEMKQFPSRASLELQEQIAEVTANTNMCIHASLLSFRHPILKTDLTIRSPAPF